PDAGLLESPAPAEGTARARLRVHAPLRDDGGPRLELRAHDRRIPRRPGARAAGAGAQRGQRLSVRPADARSRVLIVADLSFADGVRATIAASTQALDDGRTDDVVATFCPDGGCDIPGLGTYDGHEALRAAYAKWVPRRPQRHLVLNTSITDWTNDDATAVSDV